jgi:hypothetical protein
MKKMLPVLLMVLSFAAGLVAGGEFMRRRAAGQARFFLAAQADMEIRHQQVSAFKAYDGPSPEIAVWALEQLLATYARLAYVRDFNPHHDTTAAQAFTHARLAVKYQDVGQPAKAAEHQARALALSGDDTPETLHEKLQALDRHQRQQPFL